MCIHAHELVDIQIFCSCMYNIELLCVSECHGSSEALLINQPAKREGVVSTIIYYIYIYNIILGKKVSVFFQWFKDMF